MRQPLWKFTDNQGTFISNTAEGIRSLYFPLCNTAPIMASLSPDLHGDLKTDFYSYLLEPASRITLSNSRASRNFWVWLSPDKVWSATGVSKDLQLMRYDRFTMESGLLWHTIKRRNKKIGLEATITSFIPAGAEPVEIMRVDLKNITPKPLRFTATAAIPLFGRSPNNLHDHRQVTSLLNRIEKTKTGVILTPTLFFDESGHKKNLASYFVAAIAQMSAVPQYIYASQEEFTGEGSDLEAPQAVYQNTPPDKNYPNQGKEAIAGLKFEAKTIAAGKTYSYIVVMGIVKDKQKIARIIRTFDTVPKINAALTSTRNFWQKESSRLATVTGNSMFDNWLHWVSVQPVFRKIFGCSFLPDFDYGKGGRGWRDLWQDCLFLVLTDPQSLRPLLVNNFKGVRIDGSNATIIGQKPGEFIADRNNITRVWMDHGIWPLITTQLYIHQTADIKVLLEEVPYFRDQHLARGSECDTDWSPVQGNTLKTSRGKAYTGTILEHLLVQNLVQFFNVGPHNHIRLENADWNDGLDMAARNGESVAFSAMYAANLEGLAELIKRLGVDKIVILKETAFLLDSLSKRPISYANTRQKQKLLQCYFQSVRGKVSDRKIALSAAGVIADLEKKSRWIAGHIQKKEWLKEGFFNGYYDDNKKRLEGRINGMVRMTLAGQTFPIMSGIATQKQIKTVFKNVTKYLGVGGLGGLRLNTDFRKEKLDLGRAYSFSYGDKENGAVFSHMSVMFAYGLYQEGFAKEAYEVLNSLYTMAINTAKSKIYPGLPEYFNTQGKGMYSYLTGSASWFLLTLVTQMFGVRGEYGELVIEPKLTAAQFGARRTIAIDTTFAGKPVRVTFKNPQKKDFGRYLITQARLNGKPLASYLRQTSCRLSRAEFLRLADKSSNTLEITLS